MALPSNKLTIITDNPICADGTVENSDVSYSTTVASGGLLTLPDQQINVNSVDEGDIPSVGTIDIDLSDGVNPVVPTSVTITGRTIDVVVPAAATPSGVLFKTIEPSQYTSYRTGDEGWRFQNGLFNYTPPTYPKVITQLDLSIGSNGVDILKSPLIVNGVSNTHRFVDVFGAKATNASVLIIDKLTGIAHTRGATTSTDWNGAIDNALIYSITLNSITFSDWYLISKNELLNIARDYAGINNFSLVDNSALLISAPANLYSSTTYAATTTSMLHFRIANYDFTAVTKGNTFLGAIYITNARNLITAP